MDGIALYGFAGISGLITFCLMRCIIRVFMDKLGYSFSLERSILFIRDESDDYGDRTIDQKIGNASIRLNLKTRLVMILGIYIIAFLILLAVVNALRGNQSARICLYAVAIGAIISLIVVIVCETRYRAEIVFLEECGKDYIQFRKIVSDDEEMIGEQIRAWINATSLYDDYEKNALMIILETPDEDIIYHRIWD